MSNKSLEYPNSAPSQTNDVLEELSKITGIAVVRKRVADPDSSSAHSHAHGAPVVSSATPKRKTYKMGHWTCATCSADNSEAVGNRCGACGTRSARLEKRDSITSKSNSSLASLTIDELVGNLEGLDVTVDTSNSPYDNHHNNSNSINGQQPLNESFGESSSSLRFAQGNWSLRDLEKWSCGVCTYENEPLFGGCEMCGSARPPAKAKSLREETKGKAETTRAQQEQRMSELLQFRNTVPPTATANMASVSSALPPLGATLAKLAISTSKAAGMVRVVGGKGGKKSNPRGGKGRAVQTNTSPIGGGMDSSMVDQSMQAQEFSADISKPHQRRSYNQEDSNATATTFDMSSSVRMDDSWYNSLDQPSTAQQVAIHPRIAEETDDC